MSVDLNSNLYKAFTNKYSNFDEVGGGSSVKGKSKRVFVVDDDPDILEAISMMLEFSGYEVVVDTGKHIEEKISGGGFDLMLLDILLGGLDGREVCYKLKHDRKTKDLPVILISAHVDRKMAMGDCGADDFVAKPFEMDDLVEKVGKFTGKD